jgi:hypothetical protein
MCPKIKESRLLVVRSSNAIGSADTPSDFTVTLPPDPFPEGPFLLSLEQCLVYTVGGAQPPYAFEVHTSLGSKLSYDTASFGSSTFLGMGGPQSTLGKSAPVQCSTAGTLSSVRFQLKLPSGGAVPDTQYTVIVLSVKIM